MRSSFVAIASLALALAAAIGTAQAQQGSDQCLRMESQLAALDRGGAAARRPDPRQIERDIGRQQYELDRTKAYARSLSCGRGFLFSSPPPECGDLERRMGQMEINLDRLHAQADRGAQPQADPRRRELLIGLARGQCGPQYRLVERTVQRPQEQRKGFFEMLFGGGGEGPGQETIVEPEMDPGSTPRVSTFRTVCVRTCDGFFFPISYQTTQNAFQRDEAICQATCPGSEAKLFAYPNPGGQMEQANSVEGEPYAQLANAFRYRKEFVAGCSCKPEGMSWAEALAGVEDKTVKKGDIVVDEQKALEMSRPQGAPGAPKPPAASAQVRTPRPDRPELPPALQLAPTDETPFETRTRPEPPRTRDDVIIQDGETLRRGGDVETRPLDGPNVERIPLPGFED